MDIQAKISALMENEAFRDAFANAANAQEVVALFGANGVEVPLEIAQELFARNEEELSLEDLDNVAGGGKYSTALGYVYYGAGYLGGRLAGWSKSKSKNYASKCQTVGKVLGYGFDILL